VHRALSRGPRQGRRPRRVPDALRRDVAAAQSEGPWHVRLPDHGAGQPGLYPVHAENARVRADESRKARALRTAARHSRGAHRGIAVTFGVSTHLFHNEVLDAAHLATIRRHGFDAVEVFATPTHVDYRSRERAAEIAGWLKAEGLRAHSIHAPITSALRDGAWGDVWSNASVDATLRQAAIAETERAMDFAATIGARFVVIHLGIPDGMKVPAADNDAGVLARSLAAMATAARSFDLTLALEVIPNHLSTPEALVERLDAAADDETDELARHGSCLDLGHAHTKATRGARGA